MCLTCCWVIPGPLSDTISLRDLSNCFVRILTQVPPTPDLNCILDQIEQQLLKLGGIQVNTGRFIIQFKCQISLIFTHQILGQINNVFDQ